MKCIECKWYVGQTNDTYGVCKRYPQTANKSQHDWCGGFASKVVAQEEPVQKITIKFEEPVKYEQKPIQTTEYDITTDEFKPKRGRKPKQ